MTTVFIDGSAGTTGLRIADRLEKSDLALLRLPEDKRKDEHARAEAMAQADVVFWCLPDAAATEAVSLVKNDHTVVIDTSTAHRTAPGWTYGFPELSGAREKIKNAQFIANPGCHASGFVALVAPLVGAGLIKKDARLSCFSLTGYSGGGKRMIAEYEEDGRSPLLSAPRQYALGQEHKHLKEMAAITGLSDAPAFCPIVGDFYSGMEVTVPLFSEDIRGSKDDVADVYRAAYPGAVVHFDGESAEDGFLSAAAFSGRDDMQILLHGNGERMLLIARFDNLGKGASGSAIQNMNIVLGREETKDLWIGEAEK